MSYPLILLTLAAAGPEPECARIPDTTRIVPIGLFSDMRYTEEHAYGHRVELWRAGACLVGLLEISEGLAGDTPTGALTEVGYDPKSGALSFTAKLTIGVTQPPGSQKWVPSRDLFRFTGGLKENVLSGKLLRLDQLRTGAKPVEEVVSLRLDREQHYGAVIEGTSYGDWRKTVESILQFRGPKW